MKVTIARAATKIKCQIINKKNIHRESEEGKQRTQGESDGGEIDRSDGKDRIYT